jgi:hypothetical protein
MTSAPSLARATAAERILSDPGARHETGSTVALAETPDRQRHDHPHGQLRPGTLAVSAAGARGGEASSQPALRAATLARRWRRVTAERFAKCKSAIASGDGRDFQTIGLK